MNCLIGLGRCVVGVRLCQARGLVPPTDLTLIGDQPVRNSVCEALNPGLPALPSVHAGTTQSAEPLSR